MATVNPWKRFIGLLPGGSRAVGTVVRIDPEAGVSIVRLKSGTRVQARGVDVQVGGSAFVLDGRIVGPAPDLPQYDIEV